MYVCIKFKHPYMIKATPTISTMWDFPIKVALYHQNCFFAIISAEILRICRAVVQFIKTSKVFLYRMLRQRADPLGVKKVLVKMINRHIPQFEKYNTNNEQRSNSATFNITCWCYFCLMCICICITCMWYMLMCMCASCSYCFDWTL